LNEATRNALKSIPGVLAPFVAIVDVLFAQNQTAIQNFFTSQPEIVSRQNSYLEANDSVQLRNTSLLEGFLPQLKLRRKQQQVLQSISAATKTEATMAEALLANTIAKTRVLHAANDSTQLALNDLITPEKLGLAARFYFRDTESGVPEVTRDAESNLDYSTSNNPLPANTTVPGSNILALWRGYLEAPENGFYNIEIEADSGATITLRLLGKEIALTHQDGTTQWRTTESIDLRGGTLYAIALTIQKVKNKVVVRWQTAGRGLEVIPATYLYSETLVSQLRSTYIRFLKVTSLATALKLTAGEIAHFATHADYKINGQGWLNSLPIGRSPAAAQLKGLRVALMALLDFAQFKSELSPDDERLLTLLKDPEAANRPTADADSLLFRITRWEAKSFADLLSHFEIPRVANISRLKTFRRIFNAYEPLKALGISASTLIDTANNKPSAITVRNLQSALRARYSESDWLNVLKPINDEMRGLQRDALVAYILHQMRQNADTQNIDTPDKLFEYFLMDVQMEPCMQTSRIRHALSSVQLFIERCLMNLETKVSPSTINAKQWAWMKRYRVWEANRKVFLYPENWLEPELRDDQSPFFKEAMSELLQGDITEDRAAVTLLNYLAKLEEVAKLEPCGIHFVENDTSKLEDDVAHVVARTAGANRKYFYRRREFGNWTPWEQIKLDIEDNPVIPVVWNDRLFLFWLRIIKQAPLDAANITTSTNQADKNEGTSLSNINLNTLKASAKKDAENTKITLQVVLCWSEYYNGKWQGTKTSDIDKPNHLGEFKVSGNDAFDRSTLSLNVYEDEGNLVVRIYGSKGGRSAFRLYNVHSLPVLETHGIPDRIEDAEKANFKFIGDIFNISYNELPSLERQVFKTQIDGRVVKSHNYPENGWIAPFFYEDSRHVFYVNTKERSVKVPDFTNYGYNPPTTVFQPPDFQILPVVVAPLPPIRDRFGSVMIDPRVTPLDSAPLQQFVTEDAYIKKGIVIKGTIRYGDKDIGPTGILLKQPNQ
jgi:hypothetical protein